MKFQYISLILVVLLAGDLVLSKVSDLNDVFLADFNCISSSGNQKMCNAYLHCLNALSKEYLKAYYLCLPKVNLKEPGHCSATEQLYESEDKRKELNACYQNYTIQLFGSDWTTIPGLFGFKDCVSIAGTNCLTERCSAINLEDKGKNAFTTLLSSILQKG